MKSSKFKISLVICASSVIASLGLLWLGTESIFDKNLTNEMNSLVRTNQIEDYSIQKNNEGLFKTKYKVHLTHTEARKGKYASEFDLEKPIFSTEKVNFEFNNK
ncbi:TPA: hypothetical protein ACOBID_001822 [Enterococcus faecium]